MTALAYDSATTASVLPAITEAEMPSWDQLARVGFVNYRAYELWCTRTGVAPEGDEAAILSALKAHIAEPPAPPRPVDDARRRELDVVLDGAHPRWRNHYPVDWLGDDQEAHAALRRLVHHVDQYVDTTRWKAIYRGGRYKRLFHALLALAAHHRAWIRPVEDWSCVEPLEGHPRFSDHLLTLACHLLAPYQPPPALCSAWFMGTDEEGKAAQEQFMYVARGGSIRDLDLPIKLTKKMAHVFQRAPLYNTVEKSLRWAQVLGMGGNVTLAGAILKTRLGRQYEDDEFWSSVVLFLVNNAMMDPTWAGPIVDYVHNMKFVPQRIVQEGGGVVDGPPPQPNFTMKGRSANKILRQVEAWHGQLAREDYVDFQSWPAAGFRAWEMDDELEEIGKVRWTVQEMLSSWELAAEGRAMSHCVVSYSNQCADGRTSIWSICAQLEDQEDAAVEAAEGEEVDTREHVLTVAIDIATRAVTQARGRYNAVPNDKKKRGRAAQQESGGYIKLLDRSEFVMQRWMSRERLRRED